MKSRVDIHCPFCNSSRVIKHGQTSTKNPRYRCLFCNKTWVESKLYQKRPDFGSLAEAYLSGYSYRDLRALYPSSPTRINQKIREYLLGCPDWEDYLDACSQRHETRLIHLVGKNFKCTSQCQGENAMFVAMAIDALSTVVLGYELGLQESEDVWLRLLDRMNCRGIVCPTFMSYGSKLIEDSLKVVFPYSTAFNNFTRTYYDKRLKNKIYHQIDPRELILESINAYEANRTLKVKDYLVIFKEKKNKELVLNSPGHFIKRLQERVEMKNTTRFEGLLAAFQRRFEKFHMIKCDAEPIIRGWIGWWMLAPLPIGFSRLSLYLQKPVETHFTNFNCGTIPKPLDLSMDSEEMKTFAIEIAVRSLHIPIKY